jgi:hypothetical protein
MLLTVSEAAEINQTTMEIGSFSEKGNMVYWSEETKNYFTSGGSKLDIDNWTYVVDYDLGKGWIKLYSQRVTLIAVVDVFGGTWKKITIPKGYTTLNFTGVSEYSGLRCVVISSPWGFGVLKERVDPFAFENYPLVILRKELANFGWERAIYALSYFLFGFCLSYYLRRYKLMISLADNLFVMFLLAALVFVVLSLEIKTEQVQILSGNVSLIKNVEALKLSKEKVKDLYNWAFVLFFLFGYVFARFVTSYEVLYLAIVDYDKPIRLMELPYLPKEQLIRDLDGKLTRVKFKGEIKQFSSFELDGETVKGILAVDVEDRTLENSKANYSVKPALIAFVSTMAFILVADYFNIYKIDFKLSFVIAFAVALLFNFSVLVNRLRLRVEKEKVIECSELVNEENFKKMLKDAEIRQFAEDYNKLLRAYIREKITQPRKVVAELLGVIREVREVEGDEQDKAQG